MTWLIKIEVDKMDDAKELVRGIEILNDGTLKWDDFVTKMGHQFLEIRPNIIKDIEFEELEDD